MAIKITNKPAKHAKRTTKAASKRSVPTKAEVALNPEQYAHVPIGDIDVLLLQFNPNGRVNEQDVVFNVFESELERWQTGAAWLAFQKSDKRHHAGRSTWLGFAKSVPIAVVDLVETVLKEAGMEVERDMGRAVHLDLNPFARVSADGLEILVPASLVGDPKARRVIERGGVEAIARGYTVAPSKADALNDLFFGK